MSLDNVKSINFDECESEPCPYSDSVIKAKQAAYNKYMSTLDEDTRNLIQFVYIIFLE